MRNKYGGICCGGYLHPGAGHFERNKGTWRVQHADCCIKQETKNMTDLWLDDERKPPSFSQCGLHWTWAKTAKEAIEFLETGTVEFASLDHDLCDEHYYIFELEFRGMAEVDLTIEGTGMTVLNWMRDNNVWPSEGVRIHTMNTVRKPIMIEEVEKHYGKRFQYQYAGTHTI